MIPSAMKDQKSMRIEYQGKWYKCGDIITIKDKFFFGLLSRKRKYTVGYIGWDAAAELIPFKGGYATTITGSVKKLKDITNSNNYK